MPAFEEVFAEYYRKVFYFFRRKGFSYQEAEDLTQETFLRVFEHLEGLHNPPALRTWVFTVMTNVWRNRLRDQGARKRAHGEVALDESDEAPAADRFVSLPPVQEQQVLDGERREQLRLALAGLPPRMRECVKLRLERGLKYKEIATILGIKIDTVKAQLHQAKAILKAKLGEYFDIPEGPGED